MKVLLVVSWFVVYCSHELVIVSSVYYGILKWYFFIYCKFNGGVMIVDHIQK